MEKVRRCAQVIWGLALCCLATHLHALAVHFKGQVNVCNHLLFFGLRMLRCLLHTLGRIELNMIQPALAKAFPGLGAENRRRNRSKQYAGGVSGLLRGFLVILRLRTKAQETSSSSRLYLLLSSNSLISVSML